MRPLPRSLVHVVLCALALPSAALADHGGRRGDRPQVRVGGACGAGARSHLGLKAEERGIEVEFEVGHTRAGRTWSVVIVRDGQIAWRGRARTHAPSGSFSVNRRIRNLSGADRVTARATGPRGVTCTASAILPG